MKAVILSAGQGSRLLPLTEDRPKCLLAIGEDTILGVQLKALKAGGVTDVAIVTGFRTAAVEQAAEEAPAAFRTFIREAGDFAERHRVVIERFGRFPKRNAALGRASTADEVAYLAEHPDGF